MYATAREVNDTNGNRGINTGLYGGTIRDPEAPIHENDQITPAKDISAGAFLDVEYPQRGMQTQVIVLLKDVGLTLSMGELTVRASRPGYGRAEFYSSSTDPKVRLSQFKALEANLLLLPL